ncbi:MAG: hypothetical protein KDE54_09670 [Caldilineaceae bacterium]|nr:hypothetical protein [Caldilineaceae bacterium]MCB0143325.1 hypothetical protein [Caldilineaceae bacterium]
MSILLASTDDVFQNNPFIENEFQVKQQESAPWLLYLSANYVWQILGALVAVKSNQSDLAIVDLSKLNFFKPSASKLLTDTGSFEDIHLSKDLDLFSISSSFYSTDLNETLIELQEFPIVVQNSSLEFDDIAEQTVSIAQSFVAKFYGLVTDEGYRWVSPHITSEGDGDISLEWWRENKVLTIFISEGGLVESLQTWGPHVWEDMDSIVNPSNAELISLWSWIQK